MELTRRAFLGASLGLARSATAAEKRNVLFIAVDDLRPALACYGDPIAITPNIDRLASKGVVFRRAYCQIAVCNPSRASLMTGRRPDEIKVWDLEAHFRDTLPDVVTLPQHFKNNGYLTRSIGKIYHGNGQPQKDPPSWSEPPVYDQRPPADLRYTSLHNFAGSGLKRDAYDDGEAPDNHYVDGMVGDYAVRTLDLLNRLGRPFFLAVGFRKPHLPFCAPKKYWDLYDRDRIPMPQPGSHPEGAPELAVRTWHELETYRDVPLEGPIPEDKIRQLRHGYYACVSYVDAQIGRLLDELDRTGMADNTVIALWGDHGFNLGEQGLWTKSNNYEWATHAPLIIAEPDGKAGKTDALVEFVDIYPTLTELCGLSSPGGLAGASLKPLMDDPRAKGKEAAFSQFPRQQTGYRHDGAGDIIGYTVRTDHFRYVEWREGQDGAVVARELYDHRGDAMESRNVVDDTRYGKDVQRLGELVSGRFLAPAG